MRRMQIWPTNSVGRAAVGPQRDHVVETIGAAETSWNIVDANSCIINRVTKHRGGLAIKFDPDTDLRDGVGFVGLAAGTRDSIVEGV
jgi:hypothetical protein